MSIRWRPDADPHGDGTGPTLFETAERIRVALDGKTSNTLGPRVDPRVARKWGSHASDHRTQGEVDALVSLLISIRLPADDRGTRRLVRGAEPS